MTCGIDISQRRYPCLFGVFSAKDFRLETICCREGLFNRITLLASQGVECQKQLNISSWIAVVHISCGFLCGNGSACLGFLIVRFVIIISNFRSWQGCHVFILFKSNLVCCCLGFMEGSK